MLNKLIVVFMKSRGYYETNEFQKWLQNLTQILDELERNR